MLLSEAIYKISDEYLEKLFVKHLGRNAERSEIRALESVLLSFSSVNRAVMETMPPAFSILRQLLSSDEFSLEKGFLFEQAKLDFAQTCESMASGRLLGRKYEHTLYKNIVREARRSELVIDPSEGALLAVLRDQLKILLPQHYLAEFHPDFSEFWHSFEASAETQYATLMRHGVIFEIDGNSVIPSDIASMVSLCTGIELSKNQYQRLFDKLTLPDINEALNLVGSNLSGSKQDKIDLIIANMVPPSIFLPKLSLESLRDLCKDFGIATYGTKENLTERILNSIKSKDDQGPVTVEVDPIVEERVLSRELFKRLFSYLTAFELSTILKSIPHARRCTGSKETLIDAMWDLQLSEETCLFKLSNIQLEEILDRMGARTQGNKSERIVRIVDHAKSISDSPTQPTAISEDETIAQSIPDKDQSA